MGRLALALATASIISVYYYLKVVWMMCFQEPDTITTPQHAEAPLGVTLSLSITVATSLLFGVIPNLIRPLMDAASTVIRP